MQNKKMVWLVVLSACCVFIGGWWFLRAQQQSFIPISVNTRLPADIELRLNHVTFHGVRDGKFTWEISADKFDITKDQMTFRVSGLQHAELLQNGKTSLTINAKWMERNTLNGDLRIVDAVEVSCPGILMKTSEFLWSDQMQQLLAPSKITALFNDISINAEGGTSFNALSGIFRSDGPLELRYHGNVIRAQSGVYYVNRHSFTLNKGSAILVVSDVEEWLAGKQYPQIPDIPEGVKQRFMEYSKKQSMH